MSYRAIRRTKAVQLNKMAKHSVDSMERAVMGFLQLNETTDIRVTPKNNKPHYVSFIKINGKPILPPLIDEEKRKEMQKYKQKAIELELKLAKQKKKHSTKFSSNSSEISSIANIPPSRHSTPARPATLNLAPNAAGNTFLLTKSKTEGSLNKYAPVESEMISSHEKNLGRTFRTSLEQRLASDDFLVKNKLTKCHRSPIIEEQVPDKIPETEKDTRWSPLQIDSINSLRIELPTKDSTDDNLEIYLDESQNTPDTVTHSPNLMRQNSYTLLTPSPALLQYLESQKEQVIGQRSQSGRKTWDLTKAKQDWDPSCEELRKSSDEDYPLEVAKKNCSLQNNIRIEDNSLEYDSGTSPDSFASKSVPKIAKVKCKLKGKKIRSTKSVPSPNAVDKVPFKGHSKSMQGLLNSPVPLGVNEELTELLLRLKMDHERQKRELEEKQQSEMKKLEVIFQRREAEFLNKVNEPKKGTKSIYSFSSRESESQELGKSDARPMGDGSHNRMNEHSVSEHCLGQWGQGRRPHSAKDVHPGCSPYGGEWSRRARSMDFNQTNQDTDLDVSFQDDFTQSRDTTLNNEYILESDSISNFSSRSSTVSSDRHEQPRTCSLKKFQGISSEEFAKYNQAASKITAAARGYLTRRLLRTAHVQGLITTLKDAITCATQLHTASDIADSDIDLMRRLGRQIEAAWDAVYSVFFNTDTATKLQLIATDRERLRAAVTKTPNPTTKKKRISSATKKSLDRKKGTSTMSQSQTSNGFSRVRTCTKMAASYPSPSFPQKLK